MKTGAISGWGVGVAVSVGSGVSVVVGVRVSSGVTVAGKLAQAVDNPNSSRKHVINRIDFFRMVSLHPGGDDVLILPDV